MRRLADFPSQSWLWGGVGLLMFSAFGLAWALQQPLVFPFLLAAGCALVFFVLRPRWLVYFYLLTYVFGEINFGALGSLQISLSNIVIVVASLNLALLLFTSPATLWQRLKNPSARRWLLLFAAFFALEILSALYNQAPRSVLTRFSHLLALLMALVYLREPRSLLTAFTLGSLSAGSLGLLTILRGLNLTPWGLRMSFSNYGTSPWEALLPRSIGLPNMQGGLHAVYLLAFLPFALLAALDGRRFGFGAWRRALMALVTLAAAAALLISAYRSAWLGMLLSLVLGLGLYYQAIFPARYRALIAFFAGTIFLLLALVSGEGGLQSLYNLFYNVRRFGVDSRLMQYQFALTRILQPSWNALLGFGYENFGRTFMEYVNLYGLLARNPELYPWLHNYHLAVLYADGWLGFGFYLSILFVFFSVAWKQTQAAQPPLTRLLAVSVLAAVAGGFTVLSFSGDISGLHILWLLMAVVFGQFSQGFK